jgi:transcriptional regulator with XRE-family HTH domain
MEIGQKIKEVLEQRGSPATEFARRLGTSNQRYMKFFNYTQTDKNSLDCFRLRLRKG